jgi:hypothetical protein
MPNKKPNKTGSEPARDESRNDDLPKRAGTSWSAAAKRAPNERFGHARTESADPPLSIDPTAPISNRSAGRGTRTKGSPAPATTKTSAWKTAPQGKRTKPSR